MSYLRKMSSVDFYQSYEPKMIRQNNLNFSSIGFFNCDPWKIWYRWKEETQDLYKQRSYAQRQTKQIFRDARPSSWRPRLVEIWKLSWNLELAIISNFSPTHGFHKRFPSIRHEQRCNRRNFRNFNSNDYHILISRTKNRNDGAVWGRYEATNL